MHSKQGILFLAGLLLVSFCQSKFAMRQHAAFPVKQKNVHLSPSPQDPGLDQQDYVSVASSIPRGGGHGTTMSFAISLVGLVCAQVIAGLQLLQLFNDPFSWGLPSIDGNPTNRASAWPSADPAAPQRQSALRTPGAGGHTLKHQIPHQQNKRDFALLHAAEKREYVQGAGQRALDAVAGIGTSIQASHSVAGHKPGQASRWRVKGDSGHHKAGG